MTDAPTLSGRELLWRTLKGLTVFFGSGLMLVAGASFYARSIFPSLPPHQALSGTFQNPEVGRILQSEQHGAFMIGRHAMYDAQVLVSGTGLKLQPYMHQAAQPERIAKELEGGQGICSNLLGQPATELRFYASTSAPRALESYAVYHLPTHSYCLNYLEL